jgi:hypothetical protein
MNKRSDAKETSIVAKSAETAKVVQYKHEQKFDRTKPQHPGRKCVTCQSEKTTYRMDGRERWSLVGEDEYVCAKCFFKKDKKPTTTT